MTFFAYKQERFGDTDAFIDYIARNLKPDQEIGVFIHGFNTTYPEAIYRHAQIAHDFDLVGPQITFVWPSEGKPLGYLADRDSIYIARDSLNRFLTRLCRRFQKKVALAAHSMGALLAMKTLRQSVIGGNPLADRLASLVLISPDIGIEVFISQASLIQSLPEQVIIIVSQEDRLLRWSQRLAGGKPRLGEGKDVEHLENMKIVVVDLSEANDGDPGGHLTAMSSPTAISFLRALLDNETMLSEQSGSRFLLLQISSTL